jgi:hypothetical protein
MAKTAATRADVSDLSLLALLAAHEVERLQRDESADCHYVAALRNKLAHQIPDPTESVKDLAPSAVRVYRAAVGKAMQTDPQDFKKLGELLAPLIEKLSAVANGPARRVLQPADLNTLLRFLKALHAQLLAQKHIAMSSRTHSRYRV